MMYRATEQKSVKALLPKLSKTNLVRSRVRGRVASKSMTSNSANPLRNCLSNGTNCAKPTALVYSYIFDSYLQGKKYRKMVQAIENRLTDLEIIGHIHRLSQFKSIKEYIQNDIKKGAKTFVIIGNDRTISKAIDAVAGERATLGIIPVGTPNNIARILGIEQGVGACDILSARLVKKLDVGKVNGHYFLSSLLVDEKNLNIECDGKYHITPLVRGRLGVFNLLSSFDKLNFCFNSNIPSPYDGVLETVFCPRETVFSKSVKRLFAGKERSRAKSSVFRTKRVIIRAKNSLGAYIDGIKIVNKSMEIEVVPKMLNVIVGKNNLLRS